MRAALKASQQQQLDLVKGLVEQQLQQHQEQQRQHQEQQQQQLAAFQRQEELLRQLLATASTTSGVPCQTVAGPAAIQVPPEHIVRQAPKLLDYVRVNSREDGIVLGTANRGARVKVRMRVDVDVSGTAVQSGQVQHRTGARVRGLRMALLNGPCKQRLVL